MFKSLSIALFLAALLAGSPDPTAAAQRKMCSFAPKNYVPCIVVDPAPQFPKPNGG